MNMIMMYTNNVSPSKMKNRMYFLNTNTYS